LRKVTFKYLFHFRYKLLVVSGFLDTELQGNEAGFLFITEQDGVVGILQRAVMIISHYTNDLFGLLCIPGPVLIS
jgi:hypothetical protein